MAAKLGIDLIWFGVLLCVNMQTSFMHPPFGFALFYLRGIAPKEVKSSDIYLGAIPWVILQLILVAVLIFWPGMVTMWLDKEVAVDLDKVKIEVQSVDDEPKPGADDPAAKDGAAKGASAESGKSDPAKPAEEEDLGKVLQKQIEDEAKKAGGK